MEIHLSTIVMVMDIMEILTHGGINVVFGKVVNANQRVNNDNFKPITYSHVHISSDEVFSKILKIHP